MFKVIASEIKKILSKPGIYCLAVFLAIILVLGVFIYEPTVYKSTGMEYKSEIQDIHLLFEGSGENSGKKYESDKLIENAFKQITSYSYITNENESISYKDYILSLKQEADKALKDYQGCQLDSNFPNVEKIRSNLVKSLENLRTAVLSQSVPLGNNKIFVVLTTEKNLNNFEDNINSAIDFLKTNVEQYQIADKCKVYEDNEKKQIELALNNFIYPTLSKEIIKDLSVNEKGTRYYDVQSRLQETYKQILTVFDEAGTNPTVTQIKELNSLCNKYISIANTYSKLVNYQLVTNAFSFVSTSKQMNIKYLDKEDEFNSKTSLIRYKYMFDKGLTENDFARPLTIGTTSNNETNAYDYSYFVLRLFSFVIIAYAIMSACHTIAGEIKEGSMRYLAIRPVSRTTLIFGKLFAILIMSSIMAIFSAVISLCVGAAVYGIDSLKILTIFNGSTPITMHPIVMILIFIFSLILEVTVYISIALLLSCLLKSDLFAVTIMLLLYLINILMPAFVNNPNSWLAFYPFSHISFYALFGSSVFATNSNFLFSILSAKVFTNTALWLTLTVLISIILLINIISCQIFKRKEL